MIVIFSEHDKNISGEYPFKVIMQASVAIVQQVDGTFDVLKNRYTGVTGGKTSLQALEDWVIKEKEVNNE